jgi:hypothetical protein
MVTMTVKIRKTLYLPNWIVESLDKEGEKLDGPGEFASAAIYCLCNMTNRAKKEALNLYKSAEIERAYADEDEQAASQSALEEKKHKHHRRSEEAG